jgi:hypothetical protein
MLTKKFTIGNNSPNNAAMARDLRDEELEEATMEFLEDAIAETLKAFSTVKVLGVNVSTSDDVHGFDAEVTYEQWKHPLT